MMELYTGWRPLNEGILDVSEIGTLSWEKIKYYCTLGISIRRHSLPKKENSNEYFELL